MGYSLHVGAAERAMLRALEQIKKASQAATREKRGDHLGQAVALAEAAARDLRQADPMATRFRPHPTPPENQ